MGRPSDAREVLIAEALGDFATLLACIDAVTPTLAQTCDRMEFMADKLLGSVEPFTKRVATMACETQNRAVAKIAEQAKVVARNTVDEQISAMQHSARRIFNDEVVPPLHRIAGELRHANLRTHPARASWLTHSAAAVTGAWCAGALLMYLVPAKAPETQSVASAPAPGCVAPATAPEKPRARR